MIYNVNTMHSNTFSYSEEVSMKITIEEESSSSSGEGECRLLFFLTIGGTTSKNCSLRGTRTKGGEI